MYLWINNLLFYLQGDFTSQAQSVIVDSSATQYHVTDLREFTEYTFWLSAFNYNGEGALSEEIVCMTLSDIPADPPQNVSLEAASSASIIVRWEPPPKESQNGIITGYKIRWRPKGKGQSEMVIFLIVFFFVKIHQIMILKNLNKI